MRIVPLGRRATSPAEQSAYLRRYARLQILRTRDQEIFQGQRSYALGAIRYVPDLTGRAGVPALEAGFAFTLVPVPPYSPSRISLANLFCTAAQIFRLNPDGLPVRANIRLLS